MLRKLLRKLVLFIIGVLYCFTWILIAPVYLVLALVEYYLLKQDKVTKLRWLSCNVVHDQV